MLPPHSPTSCPRHRVVLATLALALNLLVFCAAQAQTQDKRLGDIMHPDLSMTSSFAGKSYGGTAAVGSRVANVRAFNGLKPMAIRGDGSYQTRSLSASDKVQVRSFATGADRAVSRSAFTQGERSYASRDVAVRELPAAHRSVDVHGYQSGESKVAGRGKRQDYFDQVRDQKDLSIDDIREILNKPNGRPGARPDVGVLPALPVVAPASSSIAR